MSEEEFVKQAQRLAENTSKVAIKLDENSVVVFMDYDSMVYQPNEGEEPTEVMLSRTNGAASDHSE